MLSSVSLKSPDGEVLASLKLSTKAMVQLERQYDGLPVLSVIGRLEAGSFDVAASVIAHAMNDGAGGDEAEAFELIDRAGGVLKAAEAIKEIVAVAFPKAETEDVSGGKSKKANPSSK